MEENTTNNIEKKTKRTPYEKGWWLFFYTFILCIFMPIFIPTPGYSFVGLFLAACIISAVLGVYSLIFYSKLPKGMMILGILQSCIFGFCFLGKIVWMRLSK